MSSDAFDKYLSEINKAYLRGDATEHTHRPALKELIEALGKKTTATNEPRRVKCGQPDFLVTRRKGTLDEKIGYIECKDINTNLTQEAKTEQIKKRYLPGLYNFILTDYIEFRWYVGQEVRLTARIAEEGVGGKFELTDKGVEKVKELLELFLCQEPERITTAKELAIRMGGMARLMRSLIIETFKQEEEAGPLHGQLEAFREVLIHDLTEQQFADMYAQTICYGLFTARCHIDDVTLYGKDKYAAFHGMDTRAKELTREHAAYLLPKTNPFFRDIFGDIAGPKLDDRVVWLVDDIVLLLRNADMGVILRDFARRKKRRDPVVHFYETFLTEYDPKLKKKRGIYYTPDEVVSYIVRSIDILLKEKFGLKRGLADESKIRTDTGEHHKLLILDPAVGTGTFLFEVIEQIYKTFKQQKGKWSGYVRDNLLRRIFGFELLMAPYAVAHMKLGLQLAETGYDFEGDERLGIYLTNTLEEAEETSRTLFAQYLSKEAAAANKVKKDLPIMVVLGNPPYSVSSQNKGPHIDGLMEIYKKAVSKERNLQPLSDDYIKFIRFAHSRIEETGSGIVGMITNHSFLSGLIHRGMREELLKTFDEIYVMDLHGNALTGLISPDGIADKNVFDIRQGVAISIFVKYSERRRPTIVKYFERWGLRKEKYEYLLENDVSTTNWNIIEPSEPQFFFVPIKLDLQKEYQNAWSILDIFGSGDANKDQGKRWGTGIKTNRDRLLVDLGKGALKKRINFLADAKKTDEEVKSAFELKDGKYWNTQREREKIMHTDWGRKIYPYLYRPFDRRWILYQPNLIEIGRGGASKFVMLHMLRRNLMLVSTRQLSRLPYCHIFVTRNLTDMCYISTFTKECAYCFPLYLYPHKGKEILFEDSEWAEAKDGRRPNLTREFVKEIVEKIKLKFVSDGAGELKETFGPEDVFHYIYAVLHSPEYRRRYAEFLKIDFPRVPMPKSKVLFRKLCSVGEKLVKLHLMESEILEDNKRYPAFDVEGNGIVEKGYPKYVAHADMPQKGKVYINKDQYFEGVRPGVWEFHIGGYQVCEKWLKYRRERKLTYEDIGHYQKIVVALGETIRLMNEPCLSEMFEKK